MESDAELAVRIAAGDESAAADLVSRYESLVRRIVQRLLDDPRDVEEVCQDALVRAIRHIAAWRGAARLATWIARIAHRAALQRLRRRRVPLAPTVTSMVDAHAQTPAEAVADAQPRADTVMETRARAERVRSAVRALPPLHRSAVTLYYLEEMSVGEVAAAMDVPIGTVKSYLFRARQQLRHLLENDLA
jgi:RNA polymerase sigma-70 factor (ECF subfamily)